MDRKELLTSKAHFAAIEHTQAVVVVREGNEIMFHHNVKNAGAWLLHVYGVTEREARSQGIEIKSIADRGPKAGDVVVYDGSGPFKTFQDENNQGGFGVLELHGGTLMVMFSASAFREFESVSISGGPGIWITPQTLTYMGLIDQTFWRWHRRYAGASEGGHYTMTVPMWRWTGKSDVESEG